MKQTKLSITFCALALICLIGLTQTLILRPKIAEWEGNTYNTPKALNSIMLAGFLGFTLMYSYELDRIKQRRQDSK